VVKHQLGQGKRSYYHKEQEQVEAVEFIDDMRSAYAWADLCICRAGALTISELIATQTPCILVPYPHAADNHQLANAKLIEDLGAGFIAIQDQELSNNITSIIEEILADTDKLKKMQQRFKPYQTPNAIVHLQSYIEGLLNA
jgi:UDP-N-acetylglucosamine--N-acetylmuramyl-(pentapeptide) pyrophosphoryl-undecaprenol N-acetylglucosamine transferase